MIRAVVALLGFVGGVACALGIALAVAIARTPAPAGPAVIRWRGGAVLAPLVRRRTLHGSSTRAPRHAEEPAMPPMQDAIAKRGRRRRPPGARLGHVAGFSSFWCRSHVGLD